VEDLAAGGIGDRAKDRVPVADFIS
jgi:hypothetical protein